MMKPIERTTIALTLCLVASLLGTGCSSDQTDSESSDANETASTAPAEPAEPGEPSEPAEPAEQAEQAEQAMIVTSASFEAGQPIPARFTCDAEDVLPQLSWSAAPDGVVSYAIIMDDPGAAGGRGWVHWVAFNITATSLDEGTTTGFSDGVNSWRNTGYAGPCPGRGAPHTYYFRVYALDTQLSFITAPTKDNLLAAMEGHVLASAELVGAYQRAGS